MRSRLFRPPAILFAALASAIVACDGGGSGRLSTSGESASPVGPSSLESVRVTAEPETVAPRLLDLPDCTALPAFRTRLSITIRAGRELFVSGVGFEFLDSSGGRSVPTPIPGSSTAASIPVSVPVPLPPAGPLPTPTSFPVPIPGAPAAGPGARVPADSTTTLPFTLHFECGIPSSGTLFIAVQTGGRNGQGDLSRTSVRVRG